MTIRAKHPLSAQIFQWTIIVLGGLYWLRNLLLLITEREHLTEITAFAFAVVIVSLKPVQITTPGLKFGNKTQQSLSLSDALTYLLLVLHGPEAAIVVSGLDGFVASVRSVRRIGSNLFSMAMLACAFAGISLSYELMMSFMKLAPYHELNQSAIKLILPLFVASAVHFLINSSLLATILGLRYRTSIWRTWVDNNLWAAVTYFPLSFLSVIAYFCVQQFGWIAISAAPPVLVLIYLSYAQYNQKVEEKMHRIEEMNDLHLSIVQALALAIDAKDNASTEHVVRVKIYGRGLANMLGLSELETQAIEAGAMLHDVGKLAIPDYILNKPGHLTHAEEEKLKIHPVVSAEILSQVKFPYPVVPVVRHHHEKWDGTGYPDGLSGEEIPLTARILSLVENFDSLREGHLHQEPLTRSNAIRAIQNQAGTAFDPQLVERFFKHLHEFEAEITARQPTAYEPYENNSVTILETTSPLDKIREAHREAIQLYEIAQSIGSSLSLHNTLTELLNRVSTLIPSTTSVVYLKDKESERLSVAHAIGRDAQILLERQMRIGLGVSGWVFLNQGSLCNSGPHLDFSALQVEVSDDYFYSLAVPLMKNNQVLGVLTLYSIEATPYTSEHTRILESIARLAGDAILNAREHEEMETTAMTDRLTGLPNLRAILKEFERISNHARRSKKRFSLVMMDLDGFKNINDTLGHKMGDRYLEAVAKVMSSQLRTHEFLGRYAGDEFVAILPETNRQVIEPLLERLRMVVNALVVNDENGGAAKAGVSLGVAEYELDGTTLETLMAAADTAMYLDKSKKPHRQRSASSSDKVIPFPSYRSQAK